MNQAFLSGDYDQALDLAFEVIRINAEIHQAWTTLASIFREIGELDRSLSAMVYAAHLRPKDISGWMRCAAFAIDTSVDNDSGNLHTARLCFSAASRADPSNIEARIGKAHICEQQGHHGSAILEYNQVLKYHPYQLDVIRKLAETSIDNRHVASAIPSAIAAYRKYFDHAISDSKNDVSDQLWHDVPVYAELLALSDSHLDAIRELKLLARWLLGRSTQTYWERYQRDDREWDLGNERRQSVTEFDATSEDLSKFGLSLPLDLRALLAKYRLKLGHDEEAMVRSN